MPRLVNLKRLNVKTLLKVLALIFVSVIVNSSQRNNAETKQGEATMRKGYYKANVIHGVYFYGETLDEPETDVINASLFYDLLPVVDDDEEITTFMDESNSDIYESIKDEYGIS